MKQRILHLIAVIGIVFFSTMNTSCSGDKKSFSFSSSEEAITACGQYLSKIKPLKEINTDKLISITSEWVILQDSALTCFMRDTTTQYNMELATSFYNITDSVKKELTRLSLSPQRSIPDILRLKLATAADKDKIQKSKDFQKASDFYEKLDKVSLYNDLKTTLSQYEKLLTEVEKNPLRKEQDLYRFIKEEDRCFRSLLVFLKDCPSEELTEISEKTSEIFDQLYSNASSGADSPISDRVMLYVSMRFNRRVIQNADACRNDIKKNFPLSDKQTVTYRWMLIQPFITIDNYSMASLTDKQVKSLTSLASELPRLLAVIDGKDYEKSPKEETDKFNKMISEYILMSYLRTIL